MRNLNFALQMQRYQELRERNHTLLLAVVKCLQNQMLTVHSFITAIMSQTVLVYAEVLLL